MRNQIKLNWLFSLILAGLLVNACTSAQAAITTLSPSSTTPLPSDTPTETPALRPGARLPTATAQVSGELGAEIDRYIHQNYPLFSGSVLVAQDGEILLSNGYRYADWELEYPNYPDTIFRLSSLTKPFTALAILMLVESGQLSLNDALCNFITDCPAAWHAITIHHLLTHTSGIPDYSKLPGALEDAALPHTPAEILAMFWQEPLEFTPGEQFSYSNSGYTLLGVIIEIVSHSSYENFLARNIFEPLGMQDSGHDHNRMILKSRASGYTINGRVLENAAHIDASNLYAAAGLYSTVEDLYRFTQALYTDQLVSFHTRERMFTPQVSVSDDEAEYGYGWYLCQSSGHRMSAHDGYIPGFHNFLAHYPDDHVDIIILSNLDTSDVRSIAESIEKIIFQGGGWGWGMR